MSAPVISSHPSVSETTPSLADTQPTDMSTIPANTHRMQTTAKFGSYKLRVFIAAKEHTSVCEALHYEHWKNAMRDEF